MNLNPFGKGRKKLVACPACGGNIHPSASQCPICGSATPYGLEQAAYLEVKYPCKSCNNPLVIVRHVRASIDVLETMVQGTAGSRKLLDINYAFPCEHCADPEPLKYFHLITTTSVVGGALRVLAILMPIGAFIWWLMHNAGETSGSSFVSWLFYILLFLYVSGFASALLLVAQRDRLLAPVFQGEEFRPSRQLGWLYAILFLIPPAGYIVGHQYLVHPIPQYHKHGWILLGVIYSVFLILLTAAG